MTIVPKKKSDSRASNKSNVPKKQDQEHREDSHSNQDHHHHHTAHHIPCSSNNNIVQDEVDEECAGYNSGDEHTSNRRAPYMQWSEHELQEKEMQFEKKINKKGWIIRRVAEDGACLFRAVADQIYGDQDMHSVLRKLCIDYIAKNSDYFSQYLTEDLGDYLKRKSLEHSHGNHIEIQAMSEMFNRPIEVYQYSSEPINIFQGPKSGTDEPIRLSYHGSVHYNSIVDPFKATVGVGLGLPEYEPGLADRSLLEKAMRMSNEDAIEKAMLEDKLLASDWEATNEAIAEQVARESYLEWLRENENRLHKKFKKSSSPQPTTTRAAACSKQQNQNASCSNNLVASGSSCVDFYSYNDAYGQAGTSSACSKRYESGNSSSTKDRQSPR